MRGGFFGLDLRHDRGDLVRAVLEGVALNLGAVLDVLRGFVELDEESRALISEALQQSDMMALLRLVGNEGASDLHLSAGQLPRLRR